MVTKFLSFPRCLFIINLLQIYKKRVMFLTLFLQKNARRFQAVVSCLENMIYDRGPYQKQNKKSML